MDAQAFPELVRHGYANCITCHHSPSGGGALTEYGRELSKEVLSSWAREGEQGFLYGAIRPPSWLAMGGDFRALFLRRETSPDRFLEDYILMQADLEAGVSVGELYLGGTIGLRDVTYYPDEQWVSRRHFALYRVRDELMIRAGKFNLSYGLNLPDHAVSIKQGLGWDQGTESYNLEASWLGESLNSFLTGVLHHPDRSSDQQERGVATQGSVLAGERFKVGASYYYGVSETVRRHVFGPFAILGFTPRFFLLSELDFQWNFERTFADPQWGAVDYLRLDFEWLHGLHTFVTQELTALDFSRPDRKRDTLGLGVQWFPRPHWEFQLVWQKSRLPAQAESWLDRVFALVHYYL